MTELQELIKKRDELNEQIEKFCPFEKGEVYLLAQPGYKALYVWGTWYGNADDQHRLGHNLAFPDTEEGKQQAIARAKEMLGI